MWVCRVFYQLFWRWQLAIDCVRVCVCVLFGCAETDQTNKLFCFHFSVIYFRCLLSSHSRHYAIRSFFSLSQFVGFVLSEWRGVRLNRNGVARINCVGQCVWREWVICNILSTMFGQTTSGIVVQLQFMRLWITCELMRAIYFWSDRIKRVCVCVSVCDVDEWRNVPTINSNKWRICSSGARGTQMKLFVFLW